MFKIIYFTFIFLLLQIVSAQSNHKVFINEFLASNVSIDADIVDFDDYSDWIELYNDEDFEVDIGGYFLTDELDNPFRWQFPAETIIPAKSFLRVWADGYDEVPGRTYRRSYYPYNYFTTKYYHLNFKLSRAGEQIGLFDSNGILVDSLNFGLQLRDISMGRYPDGAAEWYYFGEPTAGASNTTQPTLSTDFADIPFIDLESGVFLGSQSVNIFSNSDSSKIRYTLDGSKPSSLSDSFETQLSITQNSTLRSRTFDNNKLVSSIITRSYFIDEDISLPVISIVAEPKTLWDDKIGIYDNSYKEREIPIHFEYFKPNGDLEFSLNAGLRLTGQLSLYYAQKSFTIYARDRYGQDEINYQIFPERDLNIFKHLYLRNAGLPDNQNTFFRDALAHTLVLNKMDLDCQAYVPAVVFINGNYWGIYNIRDKINADYLAHIHNLNPDDIDLLEYNSSPTPEVKEGNAENYNTFYEYIENHDLSVEENYQAIENWMDIDEYINYQICEIFYDNVIWPNQNMRMWRERKDNKKWRWILYDIDYGLGMPNMQSIGYQNNTLRHATSSKPENNPPLWSTLILRKLLDNDDFKSRFIQRFSSYLNTIFHADTVLATLNQLQNNIQVEMPRHINRWRNEDDYGVPIPDYGTWLSNVEIMKQFVRYRPAYQREHIIDYFELSGTSQINFNITGINMGKIRVNDVESVNENVSRIYFKDIPMKLLAIPEIGYEFVRWEGLPDSIQNPATVTVTADSLNITAHFQAIDVSILPAIITQDTTLSQSLSPYYASADMKVDSNAILRIDPGVVIKMSKNTSIIVKGSLIIEGSSDNPVVIRPNEYSEGWGALCFDTAADSSVISYLKIVGATNGTDFIKFKAAISGYSSNFSLNQVSFENVKAPVFIQYGNMSIKNSQLHSIISGDLINIKYAASAIIENCEFRGNDSFDTDAIDFDQIDHGIIRGNRIYNFYGFNSDAIDLGEASQNILIENNIIYNIQDKGISIGHGSTATIKRNLIANCDLGIGIKDFNSFGYVEHNTFYGNNYGIACYEKNIGAGGGEAKVINSIIANSKTASLLIDALSNIDISYSLSNTDELEGLYNTEAEPGFINNLLLAANSAAIDMGNPTLPADPDGSLPDLGAFPYSPEEQISLIINEIHYNPLDGQDYEFIELVNAGGVAINLFNLQLTGDIYFTFPDEILSAGEFCVIAKNRTIYQEQSFKVYQWDSGGLPDGAGSILLQDNRENLIDYVNYDSKQWWPQEANGLGPSLELQRTSLENMVSGSWRSSYQNGGSPGKSNSSAAISGIFINEFLASNSNVNQDEFGENDDWIEIYNANEWPVNMGGLFITDNLTQPLKYQIPFNDAEKTTVPASGYLLIWADDDSEQGPMHLTFKLDKSGEQIGIAQIIDDNPLFIDSLTYAVQTADISYGRISDGNDNWKFFTYPTPLKPNSATAIGNENKIPLRFSLSQNYPNPFNPTTAISYQLPVVSEVELNIYNILGQKVATLVSKKQPAGTYKVEWDAAPASGGQGVASGVYLYRITAGKFIETKKLVLLR